MHWPLRAACLGLLALACQNEAPLDVAQVDLSRMQGTWFEIAKLPRPSQAGCTGTTAQYRLESPSERLVVNECHEGQLDGPVKRVAQVTLQGVLTRAKQRGFPTGILDYTQQ